MYGVVFEGARGAGVLFEGAAAGLLDVNPDTVDALYLPAQWRDCRLEGVVWRESNFSQALFEGCDFPAAIIEGSDFRETGLPKDGDEDE
jgi:uncharacterized protein YjbI with pentapeptide repeats